VKMKVPFLLVWSFFSLLVWSFFSAGPPPPPPPPFPVPGVLFTIRERHQ